MIDKQINYFILIIIRFDTVHLFEEFTINVFLAHLNTLTLLPPSIQLLLDSICSIIYILTKSIIITIVITI